MSTGLPVGEVERKWLLDALIIAGALPGHASKPNDFTKHYEQALGKAGAIEYFSAVEWILQSKQQETKND